MDVKHSNKITQRKNKIAKEINIQLLYQQNNKDEMKNNILDSENDDEKNFKTSSESKTNLNTTEQAKSQLIDIFIPIILFLLSYIVRTINLHNSPFVLWDEAHFGKFSLRYLTRTFYHDVHPPLGKIITSIFGYLSNQPLDFKFDSGSIYPSTFYINMRLYHALVSSFIVPLIYATILNFLNRETAIFISLLVLFENGIISISRLILLDSTLLLFTTLTLFTFSLYYKKKSNLNLFLLGISIGCVASVKWIGLFTILLIGIFIIAEIINNLFFSKISSIIIHFLKRAIFLILVPISIYFLLFVIHFKIVNKSSLDDGHMSSLFVHSMLEGDEIYNENGKEIRVKRRVRKYVPYGHVVTIKCKGRGYLHSHNDLYPEEKNDKSQNQVGLNQVTTYNAKDNNNYIALQRIASSENDFSFDFLKNDDEVVIFHMQTKKYFSVEERQAFMSKNDHLVSSSEQLTRNNVFKIEVINDALGENDHIVKTITSQFRIKSVDRNCYLKATQKNYPFWGHKQGEVTCGDEKNSLWNVEMNFIRDDELEQKIEENDNFQRMKLIEHKLKIKSLFLFFRNFIEMNVSMFVTNNALTVDEELEPARISSMPWEWIILRRGLRMCNWYNHKEINQQNKNESEIEQPLKFYMFGNPFSWYLSLFAVLVTPFMLLDEILHRIRMRKNPVTKKIFFTFFILTGYLIHYLPFFIIGRVLYFHHYFPALVFKMMCLGVVCRNKKIMIIFTICQFICFLLFAPMCYGFTNGEKFRWLKWISTWDFVD